MVLYNIANSHRIILDNLPIEDTCNLSYNNYSNRLRRVDYEKILKLLTAVALVCVLLSFAACGGREDQQSLVDYEAEIQNITADLGQNQDGSIDYQLEDPKVDLDVFKDDALLESVKSFEFEGESTKLTYTSSQTLTNKGRTDAYRNSDFYGIKLTVSYFHNTDIVSSIYMSNTDPDLPLFAENTDSAKTQEKRKQKAIDFIKKYRDFDFSKWEYSERPSTAKKAIHLLYSEKCSKGFPHSATCRSPLTKTAGSWASAEHKTVSARVFLRILIKKNAGKKRSKR